MLYPTGLDAFERAFPGRVFDVGIADDGRVRSAGIAHRFIPHGKRDHILREMGLHPQGLIRRAEEIVNRRAATEIW